MNELHDKTPQQLNMMVAEIKFPDAVIINHPCGNSVLVSANYSVDWISDDAMAFRLMADNCIDVDFNFDSSLNLESVETVKGCKSSSGFYELISVINNCTEEDKHEMTRRAICETFILMNQHKEG